MIIAQLFEFEIIWSVDSFCHFNLIFSPYEASSANIINFSSLDSEIMTFWIEFISSCDNQYLDLKYSILVGWLQYNLISELSL